MANVLPAEIELILAGGFWLSAGCPSEGERWDRLKRNAKAVLTSDDRLTESAAFAEAVDRLTKRGAAREAVKLDRLFEDMLLAYRRVYGLTGAKNSRRETGAEERTAVAQSWLGRADLA